MTAINQYLYCYFTFHHLEELEELEECVAINEMKHMDEAHRLKLFREASAKYCPTSR